MVGSSCSSEGAVGTATVSGALGTVVVVEGRGVVGGCHEDKKESIYLLSPRCFVFEIVCRLISSSLFPLGFSYFRELYEWSAQRSMESQ